MSETPACHADVSPFDPPLHDGDLGRRGIRASFHVLAFSLVRFVVQFGSLSVLARLLSPTDYGLMGMIVTATGFAALFRDMGLSTATIQKAALTHADVNDAFWINLGAGIGLAVLLSILAAPIASFYGESRLVTAMPIVGLTFVAGGAAVQHSAILRRQMRFFRIGLIETIAAVAAFLVSLSLALFGAGYWSLVAAPLVLEGVTCALYWTFCPWRPTKPSRLSEGGRLLHVGSNMLGMNVLSYISSNLDRILVGRVLGTTVLGVYTRAGSIVSLPTQQLVTPISSVMFPLFSRLREHPARYRTVILAGLRLMAATTAPAVAALVICRDWVVAILLGPKWADAAPVIPALALIAATQFIPNNLGWILVAAGRFGQLLSWNAVHLVGVAAAMAVGLRYGLIGVATGYAIIVTVLRVPVFFHMVGATSPASAKALWAACLPFWIMATVAGTGAEWARRWLTGCGPWSGAGTACAIIAALYGAMLLVAPSGREMIRDLGRIRRDLGPLPIPAAHGEE